MTTIKHLHDEDGALVGQWCPETGRAKIGTTILVPERACQVEHRGGGVSYLSCGHMCFGHAIPGFCPKCGAKVGIE